MAFSNSYTTDARIGVPDLAAVDTEPKLKPGETLDFVLESGKGVTAVYLQAATGGVTTSDLCSISGLKAKPASSVAGQGLPAAIACATIPANAYGWFAIAGTVPVTATATVAAGGKVFIGATAGQTTPATAAGKQVLGASYAEAKTVDSDPVPAMATIERPILQGQIT